MKIEEGQKQVARDTKCVRSNFTKTTVEDTSEVSFADETEFLSESEEGVWISDGTDWDELEVVSFDFLNSEYPDWKNASSNEPSHIAIDRQQKKAWLYPPPSSTYAGTNYLQIYTIEITPDISVWTTELTVPQDLHYAIAFWVIADCKSDRGLYQQTAYWDNKYREKVHQGAVDTKTSPARKIRVRSYKDRFRNRVRMQ